MSRPLVLKFFFLLLLPLFIYLYFLGSPRLTFAQYMVCTPGDFNTPCTGGCGGCACDAGEELILQCRGDGSGWDFVGSQCSPGCAGPCGPCIIPTPPPPPCTLGDCGVLLGCNCHENPDICGICGGYAYCYSGDCPPGSEEPTFKTYCTPDCPPLAASCYDTPACSWPLACTSDADCSGGGGCPGGCGGVPRCGEGGNCYTDCSGCPVPSHLECSGGSCVSVSGSGANTCAAAADCSGAYYFICIGASCVQLSGSGSSSCASDADCSGGPEPPPPFVTCTVGLSPPSQSFYIGENGQIMAQVNMSDSSSPDGQVSQINFTGYDGSLITLNPDPRNSPPPYSTTVTAAGVSGGITNVSATVLLTNGNACSTSTSVQVEIKTPTCTVGLSLSGPVIKGETTTPGLVASVVPTPLSTTIDHVTFSSDNPAVANFSPNPNPYSDNSPAYSTPVYGAEIGSTTLRATAYLGPGGVWSCPAPPASIPVNVLAPPAWFQTDSGDVHAEGDIISSINTFISPPYFSLNNGGSPGVVSANGVIELSPATQVSTADWRLQDPPANYPYDDYSPINRYDYDYFLKKVSPQNLPAFNPNAPTKNELEALADGFYIVTGDVVLPNPSGSTWVVGSGPNKKIITIFIDGNLTIQGKIMISNGFLAFIVNDNITIDPSVYESNLGTAALAGVYIANGQISTGSSVEPLVTSGVFVAHGGFNLQRDNQNNPDLTKTSDKVPAEKFMYDPELIMQAPQEILAIPYNWEEVAP